MLPSRLVVAALLLAAPAAPALAAATILYPGVVLQALDKVTARTTILTLELDRPVQYGSLTIVARTCLETPPTEPPESAAFLEITSTEPGKPAKAEFTGWMLASSPALSALEHPVYDVWVLDCSGEAAGSQPEALEAPEPTTSSP
ncbi:MAG: DUF2155 domain-containing protein [Geminicoccaceae bacterium]